MIIIYFVEAKKRRTNLKPDSLIFHFSLFTCAFLGHVKALKTGIIHIDFRFISHVILVL